MRALISIAVATAFLCCSSGMVNASPLPFLLAQPAMKPAVSVPLLSRLPSAFFDQRRQPQIRADGTSWGVSAFTNVGLSGYPGGTGYLYTLCNERVYLQPDKVPQDCSYYLNPQAPYRAGVRSFKTGYNGVDVVCPGEYAYCADETKLTVAEGQFKMSEDVAILPTGNPTPPWDFVTQEDARTGVFALDNMHINSATLAPGTSVQIEATYEELGADNIVCGGALNPGNLSNVVAYEAYLTIGNSLWGLAAECAGDAFYQPPQAYNPGQGWHPGSTSTGRFTAYVGSVVPFTSSLEASLDDQDLLENELGLVYTIDLITDFSVTTHFRSLNPAATLSFDSGATY